MSHMGKNYKDALAKVIETFIKKEIAEMLDLMVTKGIVLEDEATELYMELNNPELSFRRQNYLAFILTEDDGT